MKKTISEMDAALVRHYGMPLGLEEPWRVARVDLSVEAKRVVLRLEHEAGARFACPECGRDCALHDHAPLRRWRHLDTMQFETIIEVDAEFEPGDAQRFGLKLRVSDDGARFVRVWFDTASGDYGVDGQVLHKGSGPSHLPKGQPVRMRVFVDKQVVETFVNGQTCTTIAQVKDPKTAQPVLSDGLDLFSEGGTARCMKLNVWKMNRAEPK